MVNDEWENGPESIAPSGTSAVPTPREPALSGRKPTARCGPGLEAAHGFASRLPARPPASSPPWLSAEASRKSQPWLVPLHTSLFTGKRKSYEIPHRGSRNTRPAFGRRLQWRIEKGWIMSRHLRTESNCSLRETVPPLGKALHASARPASLPQPANRPSPVH